MNHMFLLGLGIGLMIFPFAFALGHNLAIKQSKEVREFLNKRKFLVRL